jgi:hypothetical protein
VGSGLHSSYYAGFKLFVFKEKVNYLKYPVVICLLKKSIVENAAGYFFTESSLYRISQKYTTKSS